MTEEEIKRRLEEELEKRPKISEKKRFLEGLIIGTESIDKKDE